MKRKSTDISYYFKKNKLHGRRERDGEQLRLSVKEEKEEEKQEADGGE